MGLNLGMDPGNISGTMIRMLAEEWVGHEGLFGQNPTPDNHAKLHFTIGIPSCLRSAYYIKI
jgi:hypothetical protein